MKPGAAFGVVLGAALFAPILRAQPEAVLRGRVVEAGSGIPVDGARVALAGPTARTQPTDAGGFFLLADLRAGTYVLRVTRPGYAPYADSITLEPGDRRVRGIALTAVTLPEVLVEQAPPEGVGATRLAAEALARVPSVAPGGDAGALLTTLPGVVAFEEGGQLFVRGGEAVHALFLVDGVPVYQPLHAAGGLLGVPPGAIAYIDAWPGAAPARLGGRLGAAFEVGLRAGDREHVRAQGALGPLLAAAQVECPLVRGSVSALVAGRVQAFGPLRAPGTDRRFGLYDGLARVHAFLSPLATFSATALVTGDRVTASGGGVPLRYGWDNRAAGLRLSYLPDAFPVQTEVRVYATTLEETSDVPRLGTRRSEVRGVGGEIGFRYLLGRQTLGIGLFGTTTHFATEMPRPVATPTRTDEYLTEGGVYVEGVVVKGPVRIEPGLRIHGYPSRRTGASLEPRFRVALGPEARRLYAAASIQRQEVAGDVLGSGAADVFVAWRPSTEGAPLPTALHAEIGGAWGRATHTRTTLALWHRRLSGLGAGTTTARATGLDAVADVARGPLAVRLAYGFSHVRYMQDSQTFAPPHDRPHRFDALLRLSFAPGLYLDTRFAAGAGAPYERVRGYVDDLAGPPFDLTDAPRPVVLGGETDRLPAYGRLDVLATLARTWGRLSLDVQAGVQNALGRRNVVYFDPFTRTRVDGPRFVPLVAISAAWR